MNAEAAQTGDSNFEKKEISSEPRICVIPNQGATGMEYYKSLLSQNKFDAVLFEAHSSGRVCSQAPYSVIPLLRDLALDQGHSLLVYRDGKNPPSEPFHKDASVSLLINSKHAAGTAAVLESGFSAISHVIAADVRRLFRKGHGIRDITQTMKDRYAFQSDPNLQWTGLLATYQEKYFQCMRTGKYGDDYRRLTTFLAEAKGLKIGVDLEGVLVSRRSRENDLLRTNDVRVKRYLADEFLYELAQENQIVITTNLLRQYADYLIDATGLNIPPSTTFITREGLQRINEDNGLESRVKSPTKLGLDFLFDDFALLYSQITKRAGISSDQGRYIHVSGFMIEHPEDFAESYSDPGLLHAAQKFNDIFS